VFPDAQKDKLGVDKQMRAKWMHAIRREDFIPTATAAVCKDHFRHTDYLEPCTTLQGRCV
jgi:hypothetical protein